MTTLRTRTDQTTEGHWEVLRELIQNIVLL